MAIARTVAQAVRSVPGVVDLSPGLTRMAVTYGAGQHVTGVVVEHPAADEIVLAIHVILSQAHCETAAASDTAERPTERSAERAGAMSQVADRIRDATYAALRAMASPVLVGADVLIDDMR
jgi:hypothetical protein